MRKLLVFLALIPLGCGGGGSTGQSNGGSLSGTINVFAAASLTDAFKALGSAFEKAHPGVTVTFNFAGSPTLVTQIEQGASADVFASADTTNMDKLNGDGLTSGSSKVIAHNELEIAVGPDNPKGIQSLADLAKPGVIYISAGPTVPAGKYALQALTKANVTATPKSLETDVKSVISKIELGEADAGIVYTTDVKAAGSKVTGVTIPENYNVVATYPMVAVKGTKNADVANAFIAYAVSDQGQATLFSYGFKHA